MAKKPQPTKQDQAARWAAESKKAAKTWKKSREEKAGGGFSNPEIEDGNYVARVIKAKADFTKGTKDRPSIPYVNLTLVVVANEDYEGTKLNRTDYLGGADDDDAANAMGRFAKTMDGLGYEVDKLEFHEVPGLVASINEDKPFVHIAVKNNTSASGKEYLNVFCNKVVSEEELDELGISSDAGEDSGDDQDETVGKKPSPRKPTGGATRKR